MSGTDTSQTVTPPAEGSPPSPPSGALPRVDFSDVYTLPVELVEAKDRGSLWRVVVLKSGFGLNRGSSGRNTRYYDPKVLPQLAELVEGAPIHFRADGAPTHEDRPDGWKVGDNRPADDATRVGFLRNARVELVEGHHVVTADMHLTDVANRIKSRLAHAWDRTKRALELSINASGIEEQGAVIKGKLADVVREFSSLASVDLVRFGAAGGRLVELVAGEDDEMQALLLRALKRAPLPAETLSALDEMDGDALRKLAKDHFTGEAYVKLITALSADADKDNAHAISLAYKVRGAISALEAEDDEKAEQILEAVADAPPPAAPAAKPSADDVPARAKADLAARVDELERERDESNRKLAETETKVAAQAAAAESQLPDELRAEFVESFAGRVASRDEIGADLKKKSRRWESLVRRGEVRDMGGRTVRTEFVAGGHELDKRAYALWNALGVRAEIAESLYGVPQDIYKNSGRAGLKDTFRAYTGIDRMHQSEPDDGLVAPFLRGARGARRAELLEDVQTGDLPNVLANGINAMLIQTYREQPRPELDLVSEKEITDNLHPQSRRRIDGFGTFPVRTQGSEYATQSNPSDEKIEWTPADRGRQIDVTIETILTDQIGAVRQIPVNLGRAAAATEAQYIADLLLSYTSGINDTAIYDSVVLYHTGSHANLGSLALDSDSLEAAWVRMISKVPGGETGGGSVVPKFLVVPPQLARTAAKLSGSDKEPENATNGLNVFSSGGLMGITPMVSHRLRGDANNWYLAADPMQADTLAMTYLNSDEPQVLTQDDSLVGNVLVKRTYKHVASFWFAGAVLNYRSFDGSIVS